MTALQPNAVLAEIHSLLVISICLATYFLFHHCSQGHSCFHAIGADFDGFNGYV
jgi:hypothetical protein